MGVFLSKKGSIMSDYFRPLHAIGPIAENKNELVEVALYEDHLELKATIAKHEPISLRYEQITDVFHGVQSEIVEADRSVIGRAVAGGLLFGGVGAVVGGMSGVGKKKEKTVRTLLFIISYTSKDGEDSFLQFQDVRCWRGKKLAAQLKELCGIEDPAAETEPAITEL